MTENPFELIPDPRRMIEGLRDTGYEFTTAIADIVDNSIAAGANSIDLLIGMDLKGQISVSIADNGEGMNEEGLRNAMRYGAKVRASAASLGKYGLGLKTASTAFCRNLCLTSRLSGNLNATSITWDLDHVDKVGKWEVLESRTADPEALEHLEAVAPARSGTVVSWSNVDRLIKDYQVVGGKAARKALDQKVEELREHLSKVYQRFLDADDPRSPRAQIKVNGVSLEPWDPFVTGLSEVLASEEMEVETPDGTSAKFSVKAYVLPRREEFPDPKMASTARLGSDTQGIYIYRENRLIHDADWLGMYQKEPHGSLLRVEFSFDHKLDEAFHLDIKKSQIILNDALWGWLKDQFLPAPRREADRRYREGEQKQVSAKATNGAHDTSNKAIREKEAIAGANASVKVEDALTGDVSVQNPRGTFRLKLPVASSNRPGEVFVRPVDSIINGLLFEPGIVDQHKAVFINTSHPYYHKVYVPNLARSVTVQGMDSLLWSLCVAELTTIDDATTNHFRDMRFEVSKILRALIENLPEPSSD